MKKKAFTIIVVLAIAAIGIGVFAAASAHTNGGKDIRFRAYAPGVQETSDVNTTTTGRVDVKFNRRLSQLHVHLRVKDGTAYRGPTSTATEPGRMGALFSVSTAARR